MNKRINIDSNTIKLLYKHYRKLLVPGLVILISLFLFMKFVIPQIQGLLAAKQEIKIAYDKLDIMKKNLNTLVNLEDSNLDSQLQIVSKALPGDKDFNGILNTLSVASVNAGVSLGNFSFQVGDLSALKDIGGKSLFIKLDLSINGSVVAVNNFINALNNTFPLSQIISLEIGSRGSTATIVFYYKPFPPITYSDSLPISNISKKDSVLIEKLSSSNKLSLPEVSLPISSKSAVVSPF